MKLFPNRTHYQIHTVHNVPHPDMFTEAWTTILNVPYSPNGKRNIRDPFKENIDSSRTVAMIQRGP
jgi:hypothetical protein